MFENLGCLSVGKHVPHMCGDGRNTDGTPRSGGGFTGQDHSHNTRTRRPREGGFHGVGKQKSRAEYLAVFDGFSQYARQGPAVPGRQEEQELLPSNKPVCTGCSITPHTLVPPTNLRPGLTGITENISVLGGA